MKSTMYVKFEYSRLVIHFIRLLIRKQLRFENFSTAIGGIVKISNLKTKEIKECWYLPCLWIL